MGHALRKALGVIAVSQRRGQAAGTAIVAVQAGVPQLAASSLKAALDRDWDDPAARDGALAEVLGFLDQVEAFAAGHYGDRAAAAVAVARQYATRTWTTPGRGRRCAAGSPETCASAPGTRTCGTAARAGPFALTTGEDLLPGRGVHLPACRRCRRHRRMASGPQVAAPQPAAGHRPDHRGGAAARAAGAAGRRHRPDLQGEPATSRVRRLASAGQHRRRGLDLAAAPAAVQRRDLRL